MNSCSNKKNGTGFERELAEKFSEMGWWVHLFQQNAAGQPCDMIAVKDGVAVIIDCKDCAGDRFEIRRMEPNQEAAMQKWERCGNRHCFFAVRLSDGDVRILHYQDILAHESYGYASFNRKQLSDFPNPVEFDEFMTRY